MPDEHSDAHAETPSITRLEGSRWRGGRLWSWNQDLRAWTGGDQEAGGAGATAAPARRAARVRSGRGAGARSAGPNTPLPSRGPPRRRRGRLAPVPRLLGGARAGAPRGGARRSSLRRIADTPTSHWSVSPWLSTPTHREPVTAVKRA